MRVEVHEHKAFPGFDADGNQAVLGAVKVLHAIELGHAFERSIETVFPAVIGTLQNLRVTAGLGDDGCGVMAAHVVESAQCAVAAAHDDDGLSGEARGDEFSRLLQLIGAGDELPGFAEDIEPLQFGDARIDIPRRGDGRGLRSGARSL